MGPDLSRTNENMASSSRTFLGNKKTRGTSEKTFIQKPFINGPGCQSLQRPGTSASTSTGRAGRLHRHSIHKSMRWGRCFIYCNPAALPYSHSPSFPIHMMQPMLIGSATVLVPETTPPGVFLGTQPAGAPTLGTEAPSPEVSQSTTGTCPDPTCKTICGRQQEWERHVLKHLPQHIYCPHPSCNWRGSRRYSLMDHYNKKHQHPQSQVPDLGSSDAFTIYDGKRLVKRLVNREVTLKEAIDEADASVRRMAVELGKWVMWDIQYE